MFRSRVKRTQPPLREHLRAHKTVSYFGHSLYFIDLIHIFYKLKWVVGLGDGAG